MGMDLECIMVLDTSRTRICISIWIIEIQNMGFRNASQSNLKRYRNYFRTNNIVVGLEFL